MDQNYALSYSPIMENASGDLALADAAVFNEAGNMRGVFLSSEEAITAWVCGMNNQGVDLVELPRRRGFGLVYSACPKDGGESFLFNVVVHGGFASTG